MTANRLGLMRFTQASLLFFILGCADSPAIPTAVVRDSAGVRLVEHGRLTDVLAFSVGDPLYRVGWSETDHEFARVVSGVLLSGGRAAVGDVTSDQIVVLSSTGEIEVVLGGSGEGPGEIGRLVSISRLTGDTIVVEDDGNARIAFFHGNKVIRSQRVHDGMAVMGLRAIGLQDRSLVMRISIYPAAFEESWLRAPVVLYALDSRQFDTVQSYDHVTSTLSPPAVNNPLRPSGHLGVTNGAILVARGDRPEVQMLDLEGRTKQIIRWSEERVPVSDEFWSQYSAVRSSRERRRTEEELAKYLTELRTAVDEPLPVFGGLRGDEAGRVWISKYPADYRHPTRFRVFDGDGEWLGWVNMPPRTGILDIGRDVILAIERDEFDVEAVVLLPLQRQAR